MCRADLILNWRRNAGTADRLSALGALSFRPSHPGRDALWMIARSNSLNTESIAKHRTPGRARGVKSLLMKK